MKMFAGWRPFATVLGVLGVFAGLTSAAIAGGHSPEIDPGSMVNAMLVLSGGLLIVTGRRPRK